MKILRLASLTLFFFSDLVARDFRPECHIESISATDSSLHECFVFRTTAGVHYTIQFSNDLTHWTNQDEFYGLGNEYAVSMYQIIPPPPPLPGAPPEEEPEEEPDLTRNVSIRLEQAYGSVGGTVVSWASLDHGEPIVVRIAGEMVAEWSQIPLYSERFGDYYFFVWHPSTVVSLPTENSILGVNDTAMLAELEASLPAMNEQVMTSAAVARNTPAPAPVDPDSKGFWRIVGDLGTDTDNDGIADWSEFEMAANAAAGLPVHTVGNFQNKPAPGGNPFNSDSNGDGIADGGQLDTDGDGIADAFDIASSDPTAAFRIEPLPRYALFPITPGQQVQSSFPDALQINDKGRVLYQSGTWCAGTWTTLAAPQSGTHARAFAINDHDTILGFATCRLSEDPAHDVAVVHYWTTPQAVPQRAQSDGDITKAYAAGTAGNHYDIGYLPRPMLSNDGRFNSITREWSTSPGQVLRQVDASDGTPWYENTLRTSTWRLPAAGSTICTETPGSDTMPFYGDPALNWGYTVARDANGNETGPRTGQVLTPDALPGLDFTPYHVFTAPGGILALPNTYGAPVPKFFREGTWQDAPLFTNALDMATDGTAIADGSGATNLKLIAPVLLNGKWTDIKHYAPGAPSEWADLNTVLLDTTPSGWILARRNNGTAGGAAGVLLPLVLEGIPPEPNLTKEATGVDAFSIGCDDPGPAVQDRMWIMAPSDVGVTEFTLKAPLNLATPLKLSAPGIRFNGETEKILTAKVNSVILESVSTEPSGTEIPLKLQFKTCDSVSQPIGVKIMKGRTVRVSLYNVTKQTANQPNNTADLAPSAAQLEIYLNAVFGPQLNTAFIVSQRETLSLDWDTNNNGSMEQANLDELGQEQQLILDQRSTPLPSADINVFVLGTAKKIHNDIAWGTTNRDTNTCWIVGDTFANPLAQGSGRTLEEVLQTVVHEIGHVLVGYGHPDEGRGPAPLLRTNHRERMMHSGSGLGASIVGEIRLPQSRGHRFVKGEWDEADKWLKKFIDKEGNQ